MSAVILDLSRLVSRVRHHTPSGVDRVEMAYARGLHARYGDRLGFAIVHPFGRYGRLPAAKALRFLDMLEARWALEDGDAKPRSIATVLPALLDLLPIAPRGATSSVYVQASPHHLTKPDLVRQILTREQARFLCLVHDLIPIDYPEYARPNGAALHRRRIETVAALADGVIVNSAATGESLRPWLERAGRDIPTHVALLGTHDMPRVEACEPIPEQPYFLCVGTIEPRKNHLLLLNLWRAMAESLQAAAVPRLVIVGRRGWENEQVIDMLERCPALVGHVEERNGCSDGALRDLLRGARALLLPSFAEGFGMPVTEALSVGTPVICSDLPALREAGGDAPDFIDPLDGPGWRAAILDHFRGGPLHVAQHARLAAWRAPSWEDHIAILCDAIEALCA
ncbi:glycosyltransferase family 1 protein [Sphingomonas sp. H39-1-10]|uniref:glycosyltransferase family 4 protein n=1 Tax=Sphingomonas TaxID=13687 RepID=UPI00088E4451|nr:MULTISPECIES: glycosyltransferase family 1 protein [Sphingomonas]MDF0486696.1 glycosyltransferase family 1 protein [Sphingomonas pollutisoli]SDA35509.1 Glycosyltransferase involved in cell wall bisynthesis [Sphingomonas sp. NFR15]